MPTRGAMGFVDLGGLLGEAPYSMVRGGERWRVLEESGPRLPCFCYVFLTPARCRGFLCLQGCKYDLAYVCVCGGAVFRERP
jgi:hypothetical protein